MSIINGPSKWALHNHRNKTTRVYRPRTERKNNL